jgi:hypothetical protein
MNLMEYFEVLAKDLSYTRKMTLLSKTERFSKPLRFISRHVGALKAGANLDSRMHPLQRPSTCRQDQPLQV